MQFSCRKQNNAFLILIYGKPKITVSEISI